MSNAVQLKFKPRGGGIVECVAECRGEVVGGFSLAYAQQGQLIGSAPIDAVAAQRLNLAAADLNKVLEELAS